MFMVGVVSSLIKKTKKKKTTKNTHKYEANIKPFNSGFNNEQFLWHFLLLIGCELISDDYLPQNLTVIDS